MQGAEALELSLIHILPLYRRADAMQEEEQQTELRLNKGVAHIKKMCIRDRRITAFCTGSDEDEMWRFFEVRTGSPHIVRNGCGYELI